MYRIAWAGLLLACLVLIGSLPLRAQVRVIPKEAKGGEQQGEPWAEVPETFRNLKIPDWPVPTDLKRWQEVDRARTHETLLRCLGEMPPRPDPRMVKVLSKEDHDDYFLERFEFHNGWWPNLGRKSLRHQGPKGQIRPLPPPSPIFHRVFIHGPLRCLLHLFPASRVGTAPPARRFAFVSVPIGASSSKTKMRGVPRFPLGTPYTEIVPAVAALVRSGPLAESPVVVDHTGVGRAVVDMMRQSAGWIVPVTITGGHAVTVTEDCTFHVPKKELVTCLQVVLQGRRLRIARGLHEADVLVRELQQFQVKITQAAHETFGVWREGQHDDLVLAVALACWWAERCPPPGEGAFGGGGESLLANPPEGVFLT
jgi:hypothetical protein